MLTKPIFNRTRLLSRKLITAFMLLMTLSASVFAQVNYTQNFDVNNGTWTGTRFTGTTACGGAGGGMRTNLYSSVQSANFTSPVTGVSLGAATTLSFDYKVCNWSANTTGTANPWGTALVQWSNNGTTWNTVGTIDQTNHIVSGVCANKVYNFTPTPGNLFVRLAVTWSTGDYYFNLDNVVVTEAAAPLCTGTPTAGSIPASVGFCAPSGTTTLTATGFSSGVSGLTFQWEESDDNGVGDAWADVVGGTGATTSSFTSATISANIFYRMKVTCSNGGAVAYTNECAVSLVPCDFNPTLSTGASYTSIMSTGTVMPGWVNTSGDDNTSTPVSLTGTTFRYQGNPVTGFRVCSNGWMTFNTALTATSYTNSLTSATQNQVLAPFWDDLVFTGQAFASANNCVRYKVDGTLGSGSAVITIEWAGLEIYNTPGPNLNFQVKLYEGSNNVEFIYGNFEGFNGTAISSYSYSIGYNGTTPSSTGAKDRLECKRRLQTILEHLILAQIK